MTKQKKFHRQPQHKHCTITPDISPNHLGNLYVDKRLSVAKH